MRITLEKGKQESLILLAKQNNSWPELAKKLNLNAHYLLSELRKEKRILSEEAYEKLCNIANVNYDKHIKNKLEDNWGRSLGGKNSNGCFVKNIKIPEDSLELAEFYGIMLGDGNLTKIKRHKVGIYQIRIVGDSRKDKDYLTNYIKPLIEKLFDIETNLHKVKNKNALNINAFGLRLIEFLENKGFKPGDKIRNQLTIPNWIKENKKYLKACLRGLYDTDGSIYKLTNQNVYQISFRNYNISLLKDVRNGLISLGIAPSQISKGNEITITKRTELRKFLNEVGFHNSKHLDKVKIWNLSPVV